MQKETLLIVDFGSQYVRLIARKARESGVYSEIISPFDPDLIARAKESSAIILSGGPASVLDDSYIPINKEIFNLDIPILGICYGMQLINHLHGAVLDTKLHAEFGYAELEKLLDHPLVEGLPEKSKIWASHNDSVVELAPGFLALAKTCKCVSICANDAKQFYGVQYHPETSQTEYGFKIIENFLFSIAKLEKNWSTECACEIAISEIKEKVGDAKVLLALSGGVDSSVLAYLLNKALKNEQIYPVFINHGLLLSNESCKVIEHFGKKFKNFKCLDRSSLFIDALKGITNTEEKRKIIGNLFIQEFKKYAQDIMNDHTKTFLAQGTIYSDVIESGKKSCTSIKVKTHHNMVDFGDNFDVIEPLAALFKDEVKVLGKKLMIPDWIIQKQPFPGPGLAIRVIGEVNQERLDILRKVDELFISELKEKNLSHLGNQTFAILLNQRTVGVKGDLPCYEYIAALRSVKTTDFMTAEVSEIPIQELIDIASKICKQVEGVGRVTYDITSKPPATIEWE